MNFLRLACVACLAIGFSSFGNAEELNGESLYQSFCAACHGQAGEGDVRWPNVNDVGDMTAPPHNTKGHTWRHSDSEFLAMTLNGYRDTYNTTELLNMPGYDGILSEAQILTIHDFIKTMWTEKQVSFQEKLNK